VLNSILATSVGDALSRWTAEVFNHNSTPYDAAIDAVYNQSHVGGSALHHLVDGQHSIATAFEAAAGALPDDNLFDEVAGAVEHLLRDLASVSGINPLTTMEPATLEAMQDFLSAGLGVSRSWTADVLTVNAPEALGGLLGTIPLLLGWQTADGRRFMRTAGHLGIAALYSANPLLGVIALVGAARAFHIARGSYSELVTAGARGAAVGGLLITAINVLPTSLGVGLLLAVLLSQFRVPVLSTVSAWQSHLMRPPRLHPPRQ